MKTLTVSSHYVRIMIASLKNHNIDPTAILASSNIALARISDPLYRVPFNHFSTLMRLTNLALNDEYFGLAAQSFPVNSNDYIAHAMVSATNLHKSLCMGIGLIRRLTDNFDIELVEVSDGIMQLEISLLKPQLDEQHFLSEYLLAIWHRYLCWLIGRTIVLNYVGFNYPIPTHVDEYQYLFPAPHAFEQDKMSFQFNKEFLNAPIVQNSQSLSEFLQDYPNKMLAAPNYQSDRYTDRVKALINEHELEGFPTFEFIAKQLYMTPKTLRKKLNLEGTSYQRIKDMTRRDHAINLLTRTNMPISEVATQVGFSEHCAFFRAFKKWVGVTPRAYRATA